MLTIASAMEYDDEYIIIISFQLLPPPPYKYLMKYLRRKCHPETKQSTVSLYEDSGQTLHRNE